MTLITANICRMTFRLGYKIGYKSKQMVVEVTGLEWTWNPLTTGSHE